MAKREIYADDLTNKEIEGPRFAVQITLGIVQLDDKGNPALVPQMDDNDQPVTDKAGKPVLTSATAEFKAEWDAAFITANALRILIDESDLPEFMRRLRPLVSLNDVNPEVVRAWARKNHPELKVPERGRLGAEILAKYRAEVTSKTEAGDSAPATVKAEIPAS